MVRKLMRAPRSGYSNKVKLFLHFKVIKQSNSADKTGYQYFSLKVRIVFFYFFGGEDHESHLHDLLRSTYRLSIGNTFLCFLEIGRSRISKKTHWKSFRKGLE